jgi:hypothetical protein
MDFKNYDEIVIISMNMKNMANHATRFTHAQARGFTTGRDPPCHDLSVDQVNVLNLPAHVIYKYPYLDILNRVMIPG